MARKGKRGRDDRRPPKLDDSAARHEAEAEADRLFLEAMARLENVPVKDRALDQESEAKRSSVPGTPRGSSVPGAPAAPGALGKATRRSVPGADGVIKVDLHRLTVAEAEARVARVLAGLVDGLKPGDRIKVQIITGKGRHSGSGGAVLAREIHRFVRRQFGASIVAIEDSPADLVVGELPIRGHFHVTLGTKIR